MDFHPIFVHFPIALLSAYSAIQLLPPKQILTNKHLFTLNSFLLITGSIGAILARQTGDIAGESLHQNPLVQTHELWATLTTAAYLGLSALTLVIILDAIIDHPKLTNNTLLRNLHSHPLTKQLHRFIQKLFYSRIIALISYLAFASLIITGALGGAIVYGPNVDPLVSFIYNLLVGQ